MALLSSDDLDRVLSVVKVRLREALSPVAVYFFGSYVYGTPTNDSDLDLIVVVESSDLPPHERDARAYRALRGLGVPKDVMVYTRAEFEERAALPVSFERTVKTRGRLIYAA
ncbi:Nucleotidyltransferase domain protein [Phycisphaerae bacterium RAS1]|nr:Nucleotidyltransferase domain protein [Phycisphaerae bacterium RAS1]